MIPLFFFLLLPALTSSSSTSKSPRFLHKPFINHRTLQSPPLNPPPPSCDASFLSCIPDKKCMDCYLALVNQNIAWATVTPDTPCHDVLDVLIDKKLCTDLQNDGRAQESFCNTYDNCVVWFDDDEEKGEDAIDCDKLEKCEWENFHETYIGDGICQTYGCYNTKVCGWDGGDCCEDTCETKSEYAMCGDEHFFCMDPKSESCDPELNPDCPGKNATVPVVECKKDETKFKLMEYDSFGDGWGKTSMTIYEKEGDILHDAVFEGKLKSGFEGVDYLCLKKGCYDVQVVGGMWGDEVRWEIQQAEQGGVPIASGGAPMDCTFSVGGNECENTCDGKPNIDMRFDDDMFDSYKDLEKCIEEKCVVQLEMCKKEESCAPCVNDFPPVYCFTNGNYNALTECTLCHCDDDEENSNFDFCKEKPPAGTSESGSANAKANTNSALPQCNPEQTLAGSSAIFKYSECSNIESTQAMIEEWDENNFGGLDSFEACSHAYNSEATHGGKNPLDCMRILTNIIDDPNEKQSVKDIANRLYKSGEEFCDCASTSNKDCPSCKSFMKFKTLLTESLDACMALDEIDCPAWSLFSAPCKEHMVTKFNTIDFTHKPQCDFIEAGCNDAGPFPAFRRLDCEQEISKTAWDFYVMYHRGCVGSDIAPVAPSGPTKPETPKPDPVSPPDAPPAPPGDDGPPTPKPYVAPGDVVPTPSSSSTRAAGGKRHHPLLYTFLFFVFGMGAFLIWKRRSQSFEFPRYRYRNMMRNDDVYGGLFDSMGGSSSFEPPSLPPMGQRT